MIVEMRFRRGTSTQWATRNPILESGEPGYDTTTGRVKIGNGVTRWASLPYIINSNDDLIQSLAGVSAAVSRAEAAAARAETALAAILAGGGGTGGLTTAFVADTTDPGTYQDTPTDALVIDSTDPGTYLPAAGIVQDPADPGTYLTGA